MKEIKMHSFEVFHYYEQTRWNLKDISWKEIEKDKVLPEYIKLAKSAVMGECNSIAAAHGFLNEFVDDYDFSAFVSIWGYEELQHHYAFRTWLEHCGDSVEDSPVVATRAPYPPGITPSATLATNVISEFTVCHAYRHISEQVEEPVLKMILSNASRDEARHAREFINYAQRRLTICPEELESVLETLYVYLADQHKPLKHPVSVFKSTLPELLNHETIDDGLSYFADISQSSVEKLHRQIYSAFSRLTGLALSAPIEVRRELKRLLTAHRATRGDYGK
jgi:hypothetical protein